MTSRKEIAARLREAGEDNNDWSMGANAAFFKIDDIIGAQYKSYGFFFNRLAGLIDPTCHDFGGEEGTNGENYDFACSACGWCGDVTKPNYCPDCGASLAMYGRANYSTSGRTMEVCRREFDEAIEHYKKLAWKEER